MYVQTAAVTSQAALTCSPRPRAMTPKAPAPVRATRIQTRIESGFGIRLVGWLLIAARWNWYWLLTLEQLLEVGRNWARDFARSTTFPDLPSPRAMAEWRSGRT